MIPLPLSPESRARLLEERKRKDAARRTLRSFKVGRVLLLVGAGLVGVPVCAGLALLVWLGLRSAFRDLDAPYSWAVATFLVGALTMLIGGALLGVDPKEGPNA
jgi:hypothetical protein